MFTNKTIEIKTCGVERENKYRIKQMTYEEAKPLLKRGMRVRVTKNGCPSHQKDGEDLGVLPVRLGAKLGSMCANGYMDCKLEILTEADGVTPWTNPSFKDETPKFKVGDRVRFVNTYHHLNARRGRVATIIETDKSGYKFKMDDSGERGRNGWNCTTDLELLESVPEPTANKPRFKVGDRVRVAKSILSGHSDRYLGQIGTIESIGSSGCGPYANLDIEESSGGIYLDELELLEPEQEAEPSNPVRGLQKEKLFIDESCSSDSLIEMGCWDEPVKKGNKMGLVAKAKEIALKITNPDEAALREAGIHDEVGDLTEEGNELMMVHLEALVHDKLVADAKAILADEKK